MRKSVALLFLLYSPFIFGQTIFRYGNQQVDKKEFLTAFSKNNLHVKVTDEAYRQYLDLYIRYRLKVQEAYNMKLDTIPAQVTELQNFKSQIVDQYLTDEASLNQLAKEAFNRSQFDLKISYIWVSAPKNANAEDTVKAWKKIQAAYRELKNNKDFSKTAVAYSEDPFVTVNKGEIGYITVFDLPYDIESQAYKTQVGKFSPVFRTDGGYVILKKIAQRPAWGRIRIAQILLIYPLESGEAGKSESKSRADSLYKALLAGADFADLARKFSGDNLSYQLGGIVPEFGVGKYEPGFENVAYGLTKDGEISHPYPSSFGYHIIKRNARIPVPKIPDQKTLGALKERIKSDPRVSVSKKLMLQTIIRETGFKEFMPPGNTLWDYTDSVLQNNRPPVSSSITDKTILFSFKDKNFTVQDWINYRRNLNSSPQAINGKTNRDILEIYRQNLAFDYYKQHLERYNKEYAAQVKEFQDGNLLFEVMQREVWNKASEDSSGLHQYFDTHAKDYWWKPGADVVLVTTQEVATGIKLEAEMKKNPQNWRRIIDSMASTVSADSGRFEWKQIPGGQPVRVGQFTESIKDKSFQFAYITKVYKESSPRNFEESRGLVITEYQNDLENKWITELKKKYPVTINEQVVRSLPK